MYVHACLRNVGVPVQPEAGDKALRNGLPVDVGVGRQVGIVVTHRARHLAIQRHGRHLDAVLRVRVSWG